MHKVDIKRVVPLKSVKAVRISRIVREFNLRYAPSPALFQLLGQLTTGDLNVFRPIDCGINTRNFCDSREDVVVGNEDRIAGGGVNSY